MKIWQMPTFNIRMKEIRFINEKQINYLDSQVMKDLSPRPNIYDNKFNRFNE